MTEARRKRILPLTLLLLDYLEERNASHDARHATNYANYATSYASYASYAVRHAAKYALKSQAPLLIPLVYKALSL